jgi:hypothetical protein
MPDLIPILDLKPDTSIREYGSIANLAEDAKGTVLSFTNAGPDPVWIDGVRGEGDGDGLWELVYDTVVKDSTRNSISSPKAEFNYPTPQKLDAGSTIEVKVTNCIGELGAYNASLYGHRDA